jgi:two-component system, sensor histidine kinase RpfC
VADDNATNRKIVAKILEKAGHAADLVAGGEAALHALEQHRYDLAIVDMMMPDRGGLEVIKLYRLMEPQDRRMPCIVLTANATAEAARECETAGADAYLTKPINGVILLDTIATLAGERDATPAEHAVDEALRARAIQESATALINESQLADVASLSDKPEFLKSVIDQFMSDVQTLLDQMRECARAGSYEALKDHAHAVKGSAASIGAVHLAKACEDLRRLPNSELRTRADGLVRDIGAIFGASATALSDYLVARKIKGG